MRIPVPTNKLVVFSLLGAVLTMIIAVGLATPGLGVSTDDVARLASGENTDSLAADAPTPNPDFTPNAVNAANDEEEHEDDHEAEDDHEEHEDEHDDDHEDVHREDHEDDDH